MKYLINQEITLSFVFFYLDRESGIDLREYVDEGNENKVGPGIVNMIFCWLKKSHIIIDSIRTSEVKRNYSFLSNYTLLHPNPTWYIYIYIRVVQKVWNLNQILDLSQKLWQKSELIFLVLWEVVMCCYNQNVQLLVFFLMRFRSFWMTLIYIYIYIYIYI